MAQLKHIYSLTFDVLLLEFTKRKMKRINKRAVMDNDSFQEMGLFRLRYVLVDKVLVDTVLVENVLASLFCNQKHEMRNYIRQPFSSIQGIGHRN